MPDSRWLLPSSDPEPAAALSAALGISALAARVLVHRRLADPAEAQRSLITTSLRTGCPGLLP
jgi:hypothetical protein